MRLYYVNQFNTINEDERQDWFPSRRKAEAFASSQRRAITQEIKEAVEEDAEEFDFTLAEQREQIKSRDGYVVINVEQVEFNTTKQGILDLLNIYGA